MTSTALATRREPAGSRVRRASSLSVVTVRPATQLEPPFDDELPDSHALMLAPAHQRLPFADSAAVRSPGATPLHPQASVLPEPTAWGARLLVGIIETASGRRPLHQLSALLSQRVASGLGRDFERAAALGHRHWTHAARVRSIRASRPDDGVAELCATVQAGRRVRAVALRLEARDGRWRCTRLQLG